MFSLIEKYRCFRSYHKYRYPGLFIFLGCGKALLEITLVVAVIWYAVPLFTGDETRLASPETMVKVGVQGAAGDQNYQQVEVPAVVSGVSEGPDTSNKKITERFINQSEVDDQAESLEVYYKASNGMHNTKWLMNQDANAFVIQLSSSTDKVLLFQAGLDFSEAHPVVVFPFKQTDSGQLLYGYSIGIYANYYKAQESVEQLGLSALSEGVWIRQIGELQQKLTGLLSQ